MRSNKARPDADIKDIENVLKALADGTRLRILGLLAAGETCVCTLQESLQLPQSKVSRHLTYLRRARLVDARKDGLWVHYRLARPATTVVDVLLSSVRHCIGHLDTTQRDLKRLWERAGCCELPPLEDLPAPSCCEGALRGHRPRRQKPLSVTTASAPARPPRSRHAFGTDLVDKGVRRT